MELILIRHGLPRTVVNPGGGAADPPLSDAGHVQARATARWLASDGIDRIYASPLRRAHETAIPLAQTLGLEIEEEPRVAEFDRDAEHYIPLEELKRIDYEAWRDFMRRGYPEGLDLETFQRGVIAAIEEIIDENPGRKVAVVCHGGVINTWAAHVIGIRLRLFFGPVYASINRFMAARGGPVSVVSLNEAQHLRELEESSRFP